MKFVPKFIAHISKKSYLYMIIKFSGLFDAEWYVKTYPEVRYWKKSPLSHYLRNGYKHGYDPSPRFSSKQYYIDNPDAYYKGINPLIHYLTFGRKNGATYMPHIEGAKEDKDWMEKEGPKISIIVPNYNHGAYLRERLDSIYSQTYRNFEVWLLDDGSTDNSKEILKEYAEKFADRTTLVINETNSGSPFAQWRKGLQYAKGDIIWIAESDDWCEKNFLETLIPSFMDESVMLSFAETLFMKEGKIVWTMTNYLSDISADLFAKSFEMTGYECTRDFFSKKNIIPNVSSCIFRKPTNLPLLNNEQWNSMKVCGDWIFYLNLIRAGKISYSVDTKSYYRQHENNLSVGLHQKNRYYEEHQMVREFLAENYRLTSEQLSYIKSSLESFWKKNRSDFDQEKFDTIFDDSKMATLSRNRVPNIAMCSFSFSTGGGEKVPIDLANALYEKGVAVTFIDCGGTLRNDIIREKLTKGIPLISLEWNFDKISKIITSFGIEVLHSHHANVDYALAHSKPEGVHQVVTLHGMYETLKAKRLQIQLPFLAKKIDKWYYIADKNLPVMFEYDVDGTKLKKIFNAVPDKPILRPKEQVLAELGFPEDATILTIASRALKEKGWNILYEAVANIRKKTGKNICIAFIGDGPEYEKLKVPNQLWARFVGYSDDVPSYFNALDIVMLPSVFSGESFPLCILEAFQVGKPVIATNIGEIQNMMTCEEGVAGKILQINNGNINVQELEQAILSLANDKEEYEKVVAISKRLSERYSMDRLTNLLIDEYKSCIN